MKTYNELSTECYEASKSKGWYEGYTRTRREALQLIVSELAEATEAVRDSKPFVYVKSKSSGKEQEIKSDNFVLPDGNVADWKPEGEGIELIDGAIRMFDLAGHEEWPMFDPDTMAAVGFESDPEKMASLKPLEFHYEQVVILSLFAASPIRGGKDEYGTMASAFLIGIEKYIESRGYDFQKLVAMKRAYNDTRAHRHGGKAV